MTKEEICNEINSSHLEIKNSKYEDEIKEVEIKVPIYKSNWKINILSILTFIFQKKAYFPNKEPRISYIDFTKYVAPDNWIKYKIDENNITKIAFPKFVIEHKNCWEIFPVPKFFKEDLRYGIRPINIYSKLMRLGGDDSIIVGRKSRKYYQLSSGHTFHFDYIKEYEKFINNEKSDFEWEPLEIILNKK